VVGALFADLVGLTTLAEATTPEDLMALLRDVHGRMEAEFRDDARRTRTKPLTHPAGRCSIRLSLVDVRPAPSEAGRPVVRSPRNGAERHPCVT
jgi:class 3 adenylate cyclase